MDRGVSPKLFKWWTLCALKYKQGWKDRPRTFQTNSQQTAAQRIPVYNLTMSYSCFITVLRRVFKAYFTQADYSKNIR